MRHTKTDLLKTGTIGVLTGILVSFAVWSVAWFLQGLEEHSFGSSPDAASIRMSPSDGSVDQTGLIAQLNAVLTQHHAAIIIDSEKEAAPGLVVLDPTGAIPWLRDYSKHLNPASSTNVFLFNGTYCAKVWADRGSCSLLPPSSNTVATIDAPKGVYDLQYVAVPPPSSKLPEGRFVLTSSDLALVAAVSEILESRGFTTPHIYDPPLIFKLLDNSLILGSVTLFVLGIILTAVYWRIVHNRNTREHTLRYGSGATVSRIIGDELRRVAIVLVPTVILGAYTSALLVAWISRVAVSPDIYAFLAVASGLGIVALFLAYAGTLLPVARKVAR